VPQTYEHQGQWGKQNNEESILKVCVEKLERVVVMSLS